jgi:hypothetical protein
LKNIEKQLEEAQKQGKYVFPRFNLDEAEANAV